MQSNTRWHTNTIYSDMITLYTSIHTNIKCIHIKIKKKKKKKKNQQQQLSRGSKIVSYCQSRRIQTFISRN